MNVNLRFRQVHLDFHTSEYCQNVGEDFNGDEFAETLKSAHVNSINIFAKCHHGYSYYPTKVGTPHPHLKLDLLGAQIEALHKRDILCPIYYSVLWDEVAGQQHPEWIIVNKDGTLATRPPLSGEWGWTTMDVSSGYCDYLIAQVDELLSNYDVDGFWFDICFPMRNYSPWSKVRMQNAGVNIEEDEAVWAYARKVQEAFFDKVTSFVKGKRPNATIFYNGTMNRDMRRVGEYMTHFEVESLPTTGQWGYLHYPIMARQARTYGKDFLGMNGRFHTSWGDFGGLKTNDQLDYECGTILAAGGKICVGDQLNPNGKLDAAVYRLIGNTFKQVEALEPWLKDAQPVAEIGILTTGKVVSTKHGISEYSADTEGAAQMFLEMGYQFDLIDTEAELEGYRAVVLPNDTLLDEALKAKLNTYLASGGKLILSGTAALDPETNTFQLHAVPVKYVKPAPTIPSYLRPDFAQNGELANDYDYVFYGQSHVVQPQADSAPYGELKAALFNRTWEHFMGHQHAPVGDSLQSPIAVCSNNVLYFAAPLFEGYREYDYWAYRAMAESLLRTFLPPALLQPSNPGWAEFSLNMQPANNDHAERRIVHVVCYQPRRTMQTINHVDQAGYTAGLKFAIATEKKPDQVYLAPTEERLSYTFNDGYTYIELPAIKTHAVVVLE